MAKGQSPNDASRSIRITKFPTGIVGTDLVESDLAIPATEPPPLAINEKLSVIGKPTPRIDGRLKVTGAARYTGDVQLPGMLFAHMVTSTAPHARVRSVDTRAAEKVPGVRAVHVLEKLLGSATVRDASRELASSYPIVRYAGQPIAAVAAETEAAAEQAARLVVVDYEILPFVVDEVAAREPNAPIVFPAPVDQEGTPGEVGEPPVVPQTGNVRGPVEGGTFRAPRGDVERGFTEADVTIEGEFRTQVQTHSALETHGVVADWKSTGLTVYASTQGTASVRDALSKIFSIPESSVRVVTEFVGGGFGAKFGAGNEGVLATHLSKKAGAPVRLMLGRRDEHLSVGNRASSIQKIRIGARSDGTLTAIQFSNFGSAGAGTGAGAAGPVANMYMCPNVLVEESDVFINAGPASLSRAPGHSQGCFALEQLVDELAEKLGMDPLALRDHIDDSPARRVERKIGAEMFDWSRRREPGTDVGSIKRGIGVAQAVWYRFTDMDSAVEVRVSRDGAVELSSGVQDAGGGIRTALAQIVAEELELAAADVTIKIGDTVYPAGPASGGSVTTNSITPPARNAAYTVRQTLLALAATELGVPPESIEMRGGKVLATSDPTRSITFRDLCRKLPTEQIAARIARAPDYASSGGDRTRGPDYYGGVQFAEVVVDTETGVIKVERVVAVHDCGRPINPLAIVSQVNSGIVRGISFALFENRILDRNTGLMVNANLEQYKIAGSREIPLIEVRLIEEYRGRSSTDAGGISEPSTMPTAGAIANAVYNAIGVRVCRLPMTPARVLGALADRRGATAG